MFKKALPVFLAALLIPAALLAEGTIELKNTAEAEVVTTDAKGKKTIAMVPAADAKVVPGMDVVFTTTYKNTGTKPAEKVVIINPVPEHMVYEAGSAGGEGTKATFSVDGGKTFSAPEKLRIKEKDGKERLAKTSDYTHIRWEALKPVAVKEGGAVRFRAKLE